mgnify:CR=1 FL=1
MNFPDEIVDLILSMGGPIRSATHVERVAALRIQRVWRLRFKKNVACVGDVVRIKNEPRETWVVLEVYFGDEAMCMKRFSNGFTRKHLRWTKLDDCTVVRHHKKKM